MSGFSEKILIRKFQELNPTQHSIQTLSLWLIHHRKRSKVIVNTWLKELKKAKPSKRLTFLYLCNDVVQNSRKKGPEFSMDFAPALPTAFELAIKDAGKKVVSSMQRIVNVWLERRVFNKDLVQQISIILGRAHDEENEKASLREHLSVDDGVSGYVAANGSKKSRDDKGIEAIKKSLKEEPPDAVIEPDDIADLFAKLENAPSSDADIREKISSLPSEIADIAALDKIKEKSAASELNETVTSAHALLEEYNGRLSAELEQRQQLEQWLPSFVKQQKQLLRQDRIALKEAEGRLSKVSGVRKELKAHLQSLPDLSIWSDKPDQASDVLTPLPQLHELFDS